MILIRREEEPQKVLLTLDGRTPGAMKLKNDATQKVYEIDLGVDTSTNPYRFNLFLVPSESFELLPEGYYQYEVPEAITDEVIETGKLYIYPLTPESILSAPSPVDDTIIYIN